MIIVKKHFTLQHKLNTFKDCSKWAYATKKQYF